ncbi:MAG: CsbD family protein [Proteobacteria bacterium]|nr:CsbD family protein [Pseudomonadota bacterium]
MKSITKDNVEGKMHQMTGKIKEVVGKVFKNRSLEGEGKAENLDGHVQEKISEIKKVVDK